MCPGHQPALRACSYSLRLASPAVCGLPAMASSDDNGLEVDGPDLLAEQYGTPPVRSHVSSVSRRQSLGKGTSRKVRDLLARDPATRRDSADSATAARRRTSSSRHQRRRDRKGARTFKELDTTLQVLGIGDTAVPPSNLRLTTSPHMPVTGVSLDPAARSPDVVHLASASSVLSDEGSAGRPGARQRSGLTAALQQSSRGSRQRLFDQDMGEGNLTVESLQSAREEWKAGLDALLDSNTDLQRLRTRAEDLKTELIRIATPPENTWPAREKHLDWLEGAMVEVRAIAEDVTGHSAAMTPDNVQQVLDVVLDLVPELQGMAGICCDAVGEGVRAIGKPRFSGTETKLALRIMDRQLHTLVRLAHWLEALGRVADKKGLECRWAQEGTEVLGGMGDHMVQVALDVAAELQAQLFSPGALTASLMAGGAHELSSQVKSLQVLWPAVGRLVGTVAGAWPNLALSLRREWCKLYLTAAHSAEAMQKSHLCKEMPDCTSSKLWKQDPDRTASGPTGVWGARKNATPASVTDNHLVAQAWLPSMLHRFLSEAQRATQAFLDSEGADASMDGHGQPEGIVEQLSRAVYDLGLAGMWRVHRMCASPQGLASWALELLEEQASQALIFARDLDTGPLGFCVEQGDLQAVQHDTFKVLRKASHSLINDVLALRQLLKRKAIDASTDIPRPTLLTRSESVSSITESTISTFSRPSSPPSTHRNDAFSTSSSRQPSRGPSIAAELMHQADVGTPNGHIRTPTPAPSDRRFAPSPQGGSPRSPREDGGQPTATIGFQFAAVPRASGDGTGSPEDMLMRFGGAWARPGEAAAAVLPAAGEAGPSARPDAPAQAYVLPDVPCPSPFEAADLQATSPFAGLQNPVSTPQGSPSSAMANGLPSLEYLHLNSKQQGAVEPQANGHHTSRSPQGNRGAEAGPSAQSSPGPSPKSGGVFGQIREGFRQVSKGRHKGSHTLEDAPERNRRVGGGRGSSHRSHRGRGRHGRETHAVPAGPDNAGRGSHSATPPSQPHGAHSPMQNGAVMAEANGSSAADRDPSAARATMPWGEDLQSSFQWQVPWDHLQKSLLRKLDHGGFAQVYEAYLYSAPVAVKVMDLKSGATESALNRFKKEVDLHNRLSRHPNVVRFCGVSVSIPSNPTSLGSYLPLADDRSARLAIVMELCRYGSLYKVIEVARRVSRLPANIRLRSAPCTSAQLELLSSAGYKLWNEWLTRLKLAQQAAAALDFMHAHNVLHLDITSHNLLVTETWQAKVADFNLSRAVQRDSVPHSGSLNSPQWSSPERLRGESYSKAADVFSFGVVIWELVTLEVPWRPTTGARDTDSANEGSDDGSDTEDSYTRHNFFHVISQVPQGARLPLPQERGDKPLAELPRVVQLIQQCWEPLPVQRPTMKEVCTELECIIRLVKAGGRGGRAAATTASTAAWPAA
ncbi:hypothetical protein WJX73_003050 [Symbiochloris irregularis]|uniref:Protein kinase domain-containing protein n=1 Tax=Symbiochloris irregularis TaxID=706552 RepID=A0AAW1P5U7_9CHLO